MAKTLGATCRGGNELTISDPVEFSWTTPQEVSSGSGAQAGSTGLTLTPALGTTGALGVTMLTQTIIVPTACFEAPDGGTILKVTSDGSTFRYPNGSNPSWQQTCGSAASGTGITVSVTLPAPGVRQLRPPAFEFGGISTLAVCASGAA